MTEWRHGLAASTDRFMDSHSRSLPHLLHETSTVLNSTVHSMKSTVRNPIHIIETG